jgi:hypothetical protein
MPTALYCERADPGLWGEPLNAATNLAFLVAAWAAWRLAGESRATATSRLFLVGLIAAIGGGSTLYHLFGTWWAWAFDALPILSFQLVFLWLYGRGIIGLNAGTTVVVLIGFSLASWWGDRHPQILNGSLGYTPTLGLSLGFGWYHFRTAARARVALLAASAVLAAALAFRSVDHALCTVFPVGTHFIWHLLAPLALVLLVRGLFLNLDALAGADQSNSRKVSPRTDRRCDPS